MERRKEDVFGRHIGRQKSEWMTRRKGEYKKEERKGGMRERGERSVMEA